MADGTPAGGDYHVKLPDATHDNGDICNLTLPGLSLPCLCPTLPTVPTYLPTRVKWARDKDKA